MRLSIYSSSRYLVFSQMKSCPFSPSGDNSNVRTVKIEGPSLVETCIFDGQMKSMSAERTDCSGQPSKRQEDTPMEVSSNPPPTDVFKVTFFLKKEREFKLSTSEIQW